MGLLRSADKIRVIKVDNTVGNNFYGLTIKDGLINIFIPETLDLSAGDDYFVNDVLLYLKSIELAKNNSYENHDYYTETNCLNSSGVQSCLWLIKDYYKNGLYKNEEYIYKLNKNGKINWKKTLEQLQPVISDGNLIYKDFIFETKRFADNEIVNIHKMCIKLSFDLLGWLFNVDSTFLNLDLEPYPNVKYCIDILNKEIFNTFNDNKRSMLMHMKNVLLDNDFIDIGNGIVFGTYNYNYAFEKMIDVVYGNVSNKSEFYPYSTWELKFNNQLYHGSDMRPDTIYKSDNNIYVIDAKYYRYGYTANPKDLPGTSSIQKQITYGDYIIANNPNKKIFNIFLLPYNKENNNFETDKNLLYVGNSIVSWKNGNNSHDKVFTFLIDFKYLMYLWDRKFNSTQNIKEIIDYMNNM